MKRKIGLALLFLGLTNVTQPVFAGIILQDSGSSDRQINFFQPLGQSFTAEDSSVLIAFSFFDVNQSAGDNEALTMSLYDGDGLAGSLLSQVSQILPENLGNPNGVFVDFDFSAVSLIIGNIYTATIEAPTARWGLNDSNNDLYAGGSRYISGVADGGDLRFRVTPTQVPEPSIIALFGAGLFGLGFARRRQS